MEPNVPIILAETTPWKKTLRLFPRLLTLILVVALGWAVLSLPTVAAGLQPTVQAAMAQHVMQSTITAILLDYRGYDTLGEIGVLLLALLGAWTVGSTRPVPRSPGAPVAGPVVTGLVRLVAPLMILVAAYMVWVGAHAPGGEFQGGAVLAAAGVLLLLVDIPLFSHLSPWAVRLLPSLGFAVFLGIAVGVMVVGGRLLQYPSGWGKSLLVLIEVTSTLSIGFTLAALFAASPPRALSQQRSQGTRKQAV